MTRTVMALLLTSVWPGGWFAAEAPAATVSLEIATTSRTQSTAPREWLQLLADAGVSNVRIRGARAGDKPAISTIGRESYLVVGVLASRDRLLLPSGAFGRRDTARLRDYFDRLRADGPVRLEEPTGNYGLTRAEFESVFRDLGGATLFPTDGLTADQVVASAGNSLRFKIEYDPAVRQSDRGKQRPLGDESSDPTVGELADLTVGAVLAIALRREGLMLVPEKPRGEPIRYRVARADDKLESWPVGYKPDARTSEVSPAIMEFTNVEIAGFTLAEVVDVIGPRLKIPVLWDTAALDRAGIDPTKVDVSLPRSRRTYKSILGKLLAQGRLKGELRVDEAGTPFYWITR